MLILSPIPKQFLDESGVPYTDGTVSIYLHGDTELADVYVDPEGTALIENPCILDSHGMWQGFVDPDKPMDYIVKDSEGNVITRFCNISLPTGDDIPQVKVISSDGSINVDETLENGERVFDITVNDDMFKPSCAKFSHEAVNGGGEVSFDSFELEGDPDRDIYLADGVITLAEGVYHISANFVIGNDECHNECFGITVSFGDCSTAKVWDRSFVHEESVEFGLDIVADVDGYTVVPTIAELPDDMHCSVSRLYIHKVGGAGVGGSMASVEHDGTLIGDGTHNDPLGVKDWSEIRTTLENTTNELLDHEVSHSAHQDIRDELERKEDKDNKVTSWGNTPSDEKYPSEKLVKDTLDNLPPGTAVKGDAENEYRTGNVNLTPANIGAATASQGAKADSAVQGVKVNGTELSKDGNNKVDVPVPTASTATPLKDGTASAGSSSQWARGDHRHPTDDSREAVSNKKQVVNDSSTTEYPSSKAVADFVNSSVATNTANFLGTISESSLGLDYTATNAQIELALNVHSWESTPTNNDYCFVSVNDPQTTDVDEYRRFKFNDKTNVWGYEYTLNNSSFTQAQWDAINSGLTSSDRTAYNAAVTLLNSHVGDGSIHVTSSEKNAWNAKQDAISDLATIRSGAAAGASALQPSGNGSNLSVTPDGSSTGYDLGSSTTLKAFAQKFKNLVGALKALAFKDKVSDIDINGTISDSHIASASTWNGKQNSLGINTSSGDTDKFLNERGAFATPNYPSVPSVINNLTSTSTTDALSAAQGKALNDNKASVSYWSNYSCRRTGMNSTGGYLENTRYKKILTISRSSNSNKSFVIIDAVIGGWESVRKSHVKVFISNRQDEIFNIVAEKNYTENVCSFVLYRETDNSLTLYVTERNYYNWFINEIVWNDDNSVNYVYDGTESTPTGTLVTPNITRVVSIPLATGVGSTTTPVYVDANGQVQPCDVLSGGTTNFNKRFTWTYTVNQNDQYITTAVINDNTNYIAEYVEWHNANVGKLTHPPLIILSVSARTNVANAGLISLCMYRNGEGCDVIGEDYTYMGNVHGSSARNTQYFTDRPFYNGEPYYLCIRNETSNPMWTAGTILDISIRIVAHAVSVT